MRKNRNEHRSDLEHFILTKIPIVDENTTIKGVLTILEKITTKYDGADYIYVVNDKKNLIGVFSIQDLFNYPKATPVKKFMQKKVVHVSPGTTLEKVAHLALKHNLKQIPIIKEDVFLGVVSSREILSTINRALKEDIFHFAGIHKSHLDFENSEEIPILKVLKDRLTWLIIGLVGAMFMAVYIGLFEETLAKYLIIASFIPATVYISDALGTQLQTVFIRDLAILGKEINIRKYISKQMGIATLSALVIGIFMFAFISIFWKEPFIAFTISLASFLSLVVTGLTALLITLFIKKFKFDPALGSGPIATIISDMTSVIIYFFVVVWLL